MNKIPISYDRLVKLIEESIKHQLIKEGGNAGNDFEANLAQRMIAVSNGKYNDRQIYDLMKFIAKSPESTRVKHEGKLCQKRTIINQDGSIVRPSDVGATVTDITLDTSSGSEYLSVKYQEGEKTALKITNIGIKKWFKDGDEQCAGFFRNILKNPRDAKNVAASFVGWFTSLQSSKSDDISKVYNDCCKKLGVSFGSINDFMKKCVSWAKSPENTNYIDSIFSDFLIAVDKAGRNKAANDPSRSMVATWLASLDKAQYNEIYKEYRAGKNSHNFQRNLARFTTDLNSFGFPSLVGSGDGSSGDIETFRKYLFDVRHPVNEEALKNFIAACVGYGYWMVHGNSNGSIDVFKMTSAQCKSITDSVNCSNLRFVQSGNGINISIDCDKIANLQFQFRNAHAGIIPDELLINYAGYRNIPRVREFD